MYIATFRFLLLDLGQTVLKKQDSNLFHEGITLFGSLVGVKLHRSSNRKNTTTKRSPQAAEQLKSISFYWLSSEE